MNSTARNLTGLIAHQMTNDLKQPLLHIVRELDEVMSVSSPVSAEKQLAAIREQAGQLLFRFNNLVDLIRYPLLEIHFEEEPFGLRSLLHVIRSVLTLNANANGTEFVMHIHDNVPEQVIGDGTRFGQAVLNVVENALQNTPQGGIVLVVELDEGSDSGESIVLKVSNSDSGENISHDERLNFNSRDEAQDFMIRHYKHSGLGLAVAYEIITQRGGQLSVRRERGKGTVFAFTFPLRKQCWYVSPPKVNRNRILARCHSLKVLVVDDEKTSRRLLEVLLERSGHSVDVAGSGIEAVEQFKRGNYDLVMMDLNMPEMTGIEAASRIRELERGSNKRVPIVAVSAAPYDQMWSLCREAGIDDYISKPISTSLINQYCQARGTVPIAV